MTNLAQKEFTRKLGELIVNRNPHAGTRIKKVVVSVGIGKMRANKRFTDEVQKTLTLITGQKPISTRARKAIAGFKVRAGDEVGYMVTLRGTRMWDFLKKLVAIGLPRIRDFRGFKQSSISDTGAITIAFTEQTTLPEIAAEQVQETHGLSIAIATSAKTRHEGEAVIKALGIPFRTHE